MDRRTSEVMFSSSKMDWRTPPEVFDFFNSRYAFDFDAAATPEDALLPDFIPPSVDALATDWGRLFPNASAAWVNPPYGRGVDKWMAKCAAEGAAGMLVGALVFARTDTRWWHDYVMQARTVWLIKGRIRFLGHDGVAGNSAPAPSAFVVWCGPQSSTPYFTAWERA